MDTLIPEQRSAVMKRVRSKDTRPEITVRRLVYSLGFRYRLHVRELPGSPDLVFRGARKVIFVNGCFWHRHEGCVLARLPKSKLDFWLPKLNRNRERDAEALAELKKNQWKALVVWECELGNEKKLEARLRRFLDAKR